jgi:hypothetical protein
MGEKPEDYEWLSTVSVVNIPKPNTPEIIEG